MPTRKRPRLAVTMGDPAGIGPEIIVKMLARKTRPAADLAVIGYRSYLERAAVACKRRLKGLLTRGAELVEPAEPMRPDIPLGKVNPYAGRAAVACIRAALPLVIDGELDAMVTGPINKAALAAGGFAWPGHTEMLAELTSTKEVVMMLACAKLRVTLVTVHQRLARALRGITLRRVMRCAEITHAELARYFTQGPPRLALAALNPHAGEHGLFGPEEKDTLIPAVKRLRAKGIDITGPLSADSLYAEAARGRYDAVVSLYHDQGLIPLKLLAGRRAVNVTLGLPIIRTSVDHGTGFDIAGQGVADEGSLAGAIAVAAKMVHRARAQHADKA